VVPQARIPSPLVSVPDEPGALMLPEAPTYQAVAADVDGDTTRELVRLVEAPDGSIVIEAWGFAGDAWQPVGDPVTAVPSRADAVPGDVRGTGAPDRPPHRWGRGRDARAPAAYRRARPRGGLLPAPA
jgi:hypothetical protein